MQRAIVTSLTVLLLVTAWVGVSAQEPKGPGYEGRLLRRREEQTRKATVDQLRFKRARERARQRLELEAQNERMGHSPLRPYTNTAQWALGLDSGVR